MQSWCFGIDIVIGFQKSEEEEDQLPFLPGATEAVSGGSEECGKTWI